MNGKTILRTKRTSLIVVGLTLLTILLLAASISNLELEKSSGQTIGASDSFLGPLTPINKFSLAEFNRIIAGILDVALILVFWVLVPLALLVYFFSQGDKRKKLRNILIVILVFLILPYIMQKLMAQIEPKTYEAPAAIIPTAQAPVETSPPALKEPSDIVVYLVTAISIGLIITILWVFWRRHSRTQGPAEKIRREVEGAISAIQDGSTINDTVLRCYFQMTRIVLETRGHRRDEAMTPREFEQELIQIGLPMDRVQQLTRLFERVRYGEFVAQSEHENEAVGCLKAIVEACGSV